MNPQYKLLIAAISVCVLGMIPVVSSATNAEDIQSRVQKVGKLNIANDAAALTEMTTEDSPSTSSAPADPATLYQASCFACHGTGAAGAPVLGDNAAWSARIAQGEATLVDHAINGFNAMPPRGGSTLDDDALETIVTYMVENSQ
jgi:cytochrome c5